MRWREPLSKTVSDSFEADDMSSLLFGPIPRASFDFKSLISKQSFDNSITRGSYASPAHLCFPLTQESNHRTIFSGTRPLGILQRSFEQGWQHSFLVCYSILNRRQTWTRWVPGLCSQISWYCSSLPGHDWLVRFRSLDAKPAGYELVFFFISCLFSVFPPVAHHLQLVGNTINNKTISTEEKEKDTTTSISSNLLSSYTWIHRHTDFFYAIVCSHFTTQPMESHNTPIRWHSRVLFGVTT